jgi:hypothetical protein
VKKVSPKKAAAPKAAPAPKKAPVVIPPMPYEESDELAIDRADLPGEDELDDMDTASTEIDEEAEENDETSGGDFNDDYSDDEEDDDEGMI